MIYLFEWNVPRGGQSGIWLLRGIPIKPEISVQGLLLNTYGDSNKGVWVKKKESSFRGNLYHNSARTIVLLTIGKQIFKMSFLYSMKRR
jgi:hypothetical protein